MTDESWNEEARARGLGDLGSAAETSPRSEPITPMGGAARAASAGGGPGQVDRELEALRSEVRALRDASRTTPQQTRELEARLSHLQTSLQSLSTQNERLVRTLKEAREQIVNLKKEVDRLAPTGWSSTSPRRARSTS